MVVLADEDSAGALEAPESAPEAGAVAGALVPVAAPLVPPLPPRKSVTYQPEPLSWKPAAVICLRKAEAWQAGHSVSGASEIFCKTSLLCPQDSHL